MLQPYLYYSRIGWGCFCFGTENSNGGDLHKKKKLEAGKTGEQNYMCTHIGVMYLENDTSGRQATLLYTFVPNRHGQLLLGSNRIIER